MLHFDPRSGSVVREPTGSGAGYWVGAPGAFYDERDDRFWLTYRVREPRPVRGGISRIAVSDDGVVFEDVLELRKEQLDSASIERCALRLGDDGVWRWFVCYVDPATSQWRIDRVEADSPERFDVATREPLLVCVDLPGIEGVKDPYLCRVGGLTYLFASIGLPLEAASGREDEKHATADIFNTGLTVSSTGLAVSADERTFDWLGPIACDRGAWDAYCVRLNSVVWQPPVFAAFYDGSADVTENYEERCGQAQSFDLRHWERISRSGPSLQVPWGSGSVRYVDTLQARGRRWFYCEMTRPDGAHELRVTSA